MAAVQLSTAPLATTVRRRGLFLSVRALVIGAALMLLLGAHVPRALADINTCGDGSGSFAVSAADGDGTQGNGWRGPMPLTLSVTPPGEVTIGTTEHPAYLTETIDWRDGTTTAVPVISCEQQHDPDPTIYYGLYTVSQVYTHIYLLAPDPKYAYGRDSAGGAAGYDFQPGVTICLNNASQCLTEVGHYDGFVFFPDSSYAGTQSGGSQTGGSQTGGSQTGGSQTGGSQTGGSQTGGSQTGGSQTGGSSSPQAGSSALSIPARTVRVSGGKARIKVACKGPSTCHGALGAYFRTAATKGKHSKLERVASATYSFRSGTGGTVTLRLTALGKSLLAKHKRHLNTTLEISPSGSTVIKQVLTLD